METHRNVSNHIETSFERIINVEKVVIITTIIKKRKSGK